MSIKVVFNNIMQGLAYSGKGSGTYKSAAAEKLPSPRVAANFTAHAPDVLCLAEALDHNFVPEVAAAVGLPHNAFIENDHAWLHDGARRYGNAIVSRWPLADYFTASLDNPRLDAMWDDGNTYHTHDKFLQAATVMHPHTPFYLINLHGFPLHRFKASLRDYPHVFRPVFALAEKSALPVMITGDFNNKGVALTSLLPKTLRSVVSYAMDELYDPSRGTDCLDHILVTEQFKVLATRACRGTSDHPVLYAELDLA